MKEPVLVSGTDGVGSKLKLAFLTDRHDTVGIDCVAMCANDVLCCGAEPLFFLDYVAQGKLVPEKVADIVKGVAEGCKQAGCALIGGETAELPGLYQEDEYDLVGFCVGVADREKIIDGSRVAEGDRVVGLASSGLHSNGFSLVRKIFEKELAARAADLLTPTQIYVRPVRALGRDVEIKGMAHITGGGFGNIPRMLPPGLGVRIDTPWEAPPVFEALRQQGGLSREEMFATFNMGVGMTLAVAPAEADRAVELLRRQGQRAFVMGKVVPGEGVDLCLK
jgi:phosphoribosylformylglycinamidine cyclo-ligase